MRKAGIILFNLLFGIWILFSIYVVISALWFTLFILILSPLLLIGAKLLHIQNFQILNFIVSIIFLIIGLIILPVFIKFTKYINSTVKEYFKVCKDILTE